MASNGRRRALGAEEELEQEGTEGTEKKRTLINLD
jgi:hypothetical protein